MDENNYNNTQQIETITIFGKKLNITKLQLIVIVLLSLFFFLGTAFYSIFAPFFPGEATKKG